MDLWDSIKMSTIRVIPGKEKEIGVEKKSEEIMAKNYKCSERYYFTD